MPTVNIQTLLVTYLLYLLLADGCRYVANPEFDPSLVKNASKACEGICKWVRALDIYDRVIKIVAPKKVKLVEAEAELDVQMQKLNEKRVELQKVHRYERLPYCRAEMHAGLVACCPLVSHGEYTDGTDGRTDARPLHSVTTLGLPLVLPRRRLIVV